MDERDELAQVLEREYAALYRYAFKLTGSKEEAADLVQETCVRAVVHQEKLPAENPIAWLIRVASNLYIDKYRRRKRETAHLERLKREQPVSTPGAEARIEALSLLDGLEPELRLIVILKHAQGYTYEEIGRMTGLKEGTVKSRLHLAMRRLKGSERSG